MRIAAIVLAALAIAAPAAAPARAAPPPPHGVRAAPAPHTDEDTLPGWLLPAGAVAALFAGALALRRL